MRQTRTPRPVGPGGSCVAASGGPSGLREVPFEHPAIKAGPWPLPDGVHAWQIFNSSDQGLTGWTVESNTADTQRGEVAAQFTGVPDGLQVLDLNNGRISQPVATTADYRYRVSFALSRNYVCATGSARVRVALAGASQEFTRAAGGSATNMALDAHSIEVVASGSAETLRFTSTGWGGCGGPILDAVRVESLGHADNTPPTIVATITGTLGSNGGYTSNVGVTWTVTDGESTVSSTQGSDASSVTPDTQGDTFTCTAISQGGSASESATIKRDATTPVIGYAGNAGSYSASAQDNAGNTNAASASFTVAVTSGSLCKLVQRWVSNAGVANSMCVKLRQGSYGAFRNEVSAQSGKKFLSAANAAILLRLVNVLG